MVGAMSQPLCGARPRPEMYRLGFQADVYLPFMGETIFDTGASFRLLLFVGSVEATNSAHLPDARSLVGQFLPDQSLCCFTAERGRPCLSRSCLTASRSEERRVGKGRRRRRQTEPGAR